MYNLIPLLLPSYKHCESCIANFIKGGTVLNCLLNITITGATLEVRIHLKIKKPSSLCINK